MASAMNPNLAGVEGAGIALQMERTTIEWLADLIGYPLGEGVLTSGASMANLMAIAAATAHRLGPRFRRLGFQGLHEGKRYHVYATQQTHFSIARAVWTLGLGTDNLVMVPTDGEGRIDPEALASIIGSDLAAGTIPLCVVATAGTSLRGVVDPLEAIADLCVRHRIWLHVDGAYGGFARVLGDAVPILRGLERADSVSIDPHKWLSVPYDAGCLLVRHRAGLQRAFGVTGMGGSATMIDVGLEESRRFRGLKIWAAIQFLGREGCRSLVAHSIGLAQILVNAIQSTTDLELLLPCELSTVIFRYVPSNLDAKAPGEKEREDYAATINSHIVEWVNRTQQAVIQKAHVGDHQGIRICLTNFRTCRKDIEWLVNLVRSIGGGVDRWMQEQASAN